MDEIKSKIDTVLKEKITDADSVKELSNQIIKGAESGLEINSSFEDWFENRFKYQFAWLDKDDYSKALVRALWLAPVFAGTDFGASRQRDMAQVWTDTARGFLGEIVFSKFLKQKFEIDTKFDTRRGSIDKFLPSDINKIKLPNKSWIQPKINISIKTTKFNGRWLDVPGAQYNYSDVFILIKLGILRGHFLAFLKAISFLKDKLFPLGKNLKELDDVSSKELWEEIPEFEPIPSYIAGFIDKRKINLPIHYLEVRRKGLKNICLLISQGIGIFTPDNIRNHQTVKEIDPEGKLRIEIEPIIKSFTGQKFFAHSGGLYYGKEKWQELIDKF